MSKRTLVQASRNIWCCASETETEWIELGMGCLQRIASSLEGIHVQLTYLNNRSDYKDKSISRLQTRVKNLNKKLKEKA